MCSVSASASMASIAPGANATMMSANLTWVVSAITATKIAEMMLAMANDPSAALTWLSRILLSHVNAALGSFAIAIIISAIFVAVIALTTHVRFADIIVAFAPGAMDAMLALALTLHIDPIFVGAHHLSRFVFVTIATPGIVHLFGRPQDDVDD